MKKLLLLGSVAGVVPPLKQGGIENVAYVQAKMLAKLGMPLMLVAAVGSEAAFKEKLKQESEPDQNKILANVEFVEIGGGTQAGNAEGAFKIDPSKMESSRLLRMELVNLAKVSQLLIQRENDYSAILNNMRGEAVFLPIAQQLNKPFFNVLHLPLFPTLAEIFKEFQTHVITISNNQRNEFPNLNYTATIYNPVNIHTLTYNPNPKNYALMLSTIANHKNQKDAIIACRKAGIPLVLAGKIRDKDYFENEIKPFIDGKNVTYLSEVGFEEKRKLYQEAKMLLFPIIWTEPFGLIVVESMSCGTPVIAYPNGGPKEIIRDGKTGFLVENVDDMAEKIKMIDQINREDVRKNVEERFSEEVIGKEYFDVLKPFLQ